MAKWAGVAACVFGCAALLGCNQANGVATTTILKIQAAAGNVESQRILGRRYYLGQNAKKDFGLAFAYFNKCADVNYVDCSTYVGKLYQAGLGTPLDLAKAVHFYSKNVNDPVWSDGAKIMLGRMYLEGEGVPKDPAKAFSLLSGETKDKTAALTVAQMYLTGVGVQQDDVKANELLKIANAKSFDYQVEQNGLLPTP